jgi:hypothetical protein
MDSQKWLEYARYKAFPLSAVISRGWKMEAGKEARTAVRSCTATTRGEWETLESFRAEHRPIGFRMVWTANICAGGESYDADTISFVGRMDYYPNRNACSTSARDAASTPRTPTEPSFNDRRRGAHRCRASVERVARVTVTALSLTCDRIFNGPRS